MVLWGAVDPETDNVGGVCVGGGVLLSCVCARGCLCLLFVWECVVLPLYKAFAPGAHTQPMRTACACTSRALSTQAHVWQAQATGFPYDKNRIYGTYNPNRINIFRINNVSISCISFKIMESANPAQAPPRARRCP